MCLLQLRTEGGILSLQDAHPLLPTLVIPPFDAPRPPCIGPDRALFVIRVTSLLHKAFEDIEVKNASSHGNLFSS